MVKPLAFKGDKKAKKRKRRDEEKLDPHDDDGGNTAGDDSSRALTTTTTKAEDDGATTTTTTTTATTTAAPDEDDSWVSAEVAADITGPIVFALPTSPSRTCIACDATGTVFLSRLENLVEGDVGTAEPHEVRQVWVANRVAGTEHISFKGHHGRYVLWSGPTAPTSDG